MQLNDLYRAVLEKLTVVASGTPADADDIKTVRTKYGKLYEMLDGEDLVNWTSGADVPDGAAEPIISMLAFMCAREFGQDPGPLAAEGALFAPAISLGERQLRRFVASKFISTPQATEYF